jgi:hypothetical protein
VGGFLFSGYSLGLQKPKKEASSRAKNRHRSLSRIYKDPGNTRSTRRPNPPRDSKLKAKHSFLERLARATAAPSPPTDQRYPCHSISYPFPLPLSLSYNRDRERGYPERDPSPRRKRAPSPPTGQRFEGRPLGRVQRPPQATRAPRPLLIRGS